MNRNGKRIEKQVPPLHKSAHTMGYTHSHIITYTNLHHRQRAGHGIVRHKQPGHRVAGLAFVHIWKPSIQTLSFKCKKRRKKKQTKTPTDRLTESNVAVLHVAPLPHDRAIRATTAERTNSKY